MEVAVGNARKLSESSRSRVVQRAVVKVVSGRRWWSVCNVLQRRAAGWWWSATYVERKRVGGQGCAYNTDEMINGPRYERTDA